MFKQLSGSGKKTVYLGSPLETWAYWTEEQAEARIECVILFAKVLLNKI